MRTMTRSLITGAGISAVVLVSLVALFVVLHRDSEAASPQSADATFAELQARFSHQAPLLDMDRRQVAVRPTAKARKELHSFHAVIFDTRGGERLVRISAPYWFARAFTHDRQFHWLGELTFFDDTEFDPEEIRLSLSDIERHGPGLLVDHRHAGGGRFMAWVD